MLEAGRKWTRLRPQQDDYRHKVYRLSSTSRVTGDTVPMNLPEKLVRDKATVPLEQKDGRCMAGGL